MSEPRVSQVRIVRIAKQLLVGKAHSCEVNLDDEEHVQQRMTIRNLQNDSFSDLHKNNSNTTPVSISNIPSPINVTTRSFAEFSTGASINQLEK